jgi:hypothetical protein
MLSEAQEKNYWVNKLEHGWKALKMNELWGLKCACYVQNIIQWKQRGLSRGLSIMLAWALLGALNALMLWVFVTERIYVENFCHWTHFEFNFFLLNALLMQISPLNAFLMQKFVHWTHFDAENDFLYIRIKSLISSLIRRLPN